MIRGNSIRPLEAVSGNYRFMKNLFLGPKALDLGLDSQRDMKTHAFGPAIEISSNDIGHE